MKNYQAFLKAIRKRNIDDILGIASEVEGKSLEEVEEYMKAFMSRFRELKERDLVQRKIRENDFDKKNIETILNFDITKDYCLYLQDNHYFNRNSYLAMIQRAHQ